MKVLYYRLIAAFHVILVTSGLLFIGLLVLAFTNLPFYAYHWLGTSVSGIKDKPEYIIFMGGGGMPSESNLMRIHYTARAAHSFPKSKVIISIPGELPDENSTPVKVRDNLLLYGVGSSRIFFENKGTNTRSQALNLRLFNGEPLMNKAVLIVSSPEHMRRAILSFEKAGFTNVSGLPAFENTLESDLEFHDDQLGGNRFMIPDVGDHTAVRYQFWTHLKYEVMVARELAAISFYKMRAWI